MHPVPPAQTLTPHPDYFTTLLWRQLVGTTVLNSSVTGPDAHFLASAWCASARAPYGDGGSVVIAFANSADSEATIRLPAVLAAASFTYFELTPAASPPTFEDLQSDVAFLNGKKLAVLPDGSLPEFPFPGVESGPLAELVVGAYSYGFGVFDTSASDVPACAA